MLLFLMTVTLTLPLFATMMVVVQALVDLQKRESTPFLAPADLHCHQMASHQLYVPVGLLHIYRLTATGHGSYGTPVWRS